MKNYKLILIMFLGTFLFACEDEVVDPIITVTPPATYTFERGGQTTVSYSGQSARLEMAGELSVWLNTPTKTAAELDESMREKLKTNALQKWVNKERSRHDIFAEFNSDVYAWVGDQLRLNDRSPTPTPNPDPLQQFISSGS